MIYNYIQTNTVTESTKEEEIISVVWNEYCNYKQILENCTDESTKPILEAQVEVLYEVSISDIVDKIKTFISKIIKAIKDILSKIRDIFTDRKMKSADGIKRAIEYCKGRNIKMPKIENESSTIVDSNYYISEGANSELDHKLAGIVAHTAHMKDFYFDMDDYYIRYNVNYPSSIEIDALLTSGNNQNLPKHIDDILNDINSLSIIDVSKLPSTVTNNFNINSFSDFVESNLENKRDNHLTTKYDIHTLLLMGHDARNKANSRLNSVIGMLNDIQSKCDIIYKTIDNQKNSTHYGLSSVMKILKQVNLNVSIMSLMKTKMISLIDITNRMNTNCITCFKYTIP